MRKLAVAARLFGSELYRLKLKRVDLAKADLRLAEKAYATGITEGQAELVSTLDRVTLRIGQLRQQEVGATSTFGGKAKAFAIKAAKTVQIGVLQRKRRRILRQLGTNLRQSGANGSLAEETQAASAVANRIESLNAELRGLAPQTYLWARRPLLLVCLLLLLAVIAGAFSVKRQSTAGLAQQSGWERSSLSEAQMNKILAQQQAFAQQTQQMVAEATRRETEQRQARIAAAERQYNEKRERERAEVEKRQREEAQERERVAAAERARAEEKQREEERRIAAEKAKKEQQEQQAREAEAQRENERQKAVAIAEQPTKQNAGEELVKVKTAAETGDADAMFKLGVLYAKGEGVAEDPAEAERWFRKAADAGNTNAIGVLQALQHLKEAWDNSLILHDGRHVLVGDKPGEFSWLKSWINPALVKLTGADREEAERLLRERQSRPGNTAPSAAVPTQPATSSSSGAAWANSYRNAKFITYAELLRRVGPVHLTIRGSDAVRQCEPDLEDLVKTSATEHGWKLVPDATDFELVVNTDIYGSKITQQAGFTQIYTISMGIALRTTANCRRGDKFVRLTVEPYRSYTYYYGAMGDLSDFKRGYAKGFSSCIKTLFNGMAEMTDADSKDDEAAWTASLWPRAKDAEMQKNFLAPVQGDAARSESVFQGITNFALRPVKLVDKAGHYLDARSVEEAWATELSRNGQAIDQSSDVTIVDDIGTYWQTLSPLGFGDRGFYMNYCSVNVWQKNVVFKVNSELRRGTVHIWGAEKVVMALSEQQSGLWTVEKLDIPLLSKQFALGR